MKNKANYLRYGLNVIILTGLVWAIVKYVDGQALRLAIRQLSIYDILVLLGLTLLFFLIRAGRFLILASPFADHVSNWTVFKGYVSGQAAVLLPGGIAARAGLLNQVGVPPAHSSVPVAFHSGWDQALFLLGGMIAALWFPAVRLPVFVMLSVLTAVAIALLLPSARTWLAGNALSIAKRFDLEAQLNRFRKAIPRVFSWPILLSSLVITIVTFALQIMILEIAMNRLALEAPLHTLLLAFIVPTMLGRIIPVPGGFGVTEAGMVGFLTSLAQLSMDATVAAVAIFRIVTIVIPAVAGAMVYFFFWKGRGEKIIRRQP